VGGNKEDQAVKEQTGSRKTNGTAQDVGEDRKTHTHRPAGTGTRRRVPDPREMQKGGKEEKISARDDERSEKRGRKS